MQIIAALILATSGLTAVCAAPLRRACADDNLQKFNTTLSGISPNPVVADKGQFNLIVTDTTAENLSDVEADLGAPVDLISACGFSGRSVAAFKTVDEAIQQSCSSFQDLCVLGGSIIEDGTNNASKDCTGLEDKCLAANKVVKAAAACKPTNLQKFNQTGAGGPQPVIEDGGKFKLVVEDTNFANLASVEDSLGEFFNVIQNCDVVGRAGDVENTAEAAIRSSCSLFEEQCLESSEDAFNGIEDPKCVGLNDKCLAANNLKA